MYTRLEVVSRWLEWTGIEHRGNYQPMLDRLAGSGSAAALRALADASEALGIEGRRGVRQYTSLVPLNRFVDAVRPESELVQRLEQDVARIASDRAAAEELRAALTEWANIEGRITIPELLPLSANLATVGRIGLEALALIETAQAAPAGWVEEKGRELNRMDAPIAEVKLAAVRVVRALLTAATKRQTAENSCVRWGNEPRCNGPATVPNWTFAWARPSMHNRGWSYEIEGFCATNPNSGDRL